MERSFNLILVRTEGAVNIGLCARAIKNFGAKGLVLVQPFAPHLGKEALGYAAHAQDVLKNARVYQDLAPALQGFDLILGFSRREGQYRRRDLFLRDLPDFLSTHGAQNIALMLGNEKDGLSDGELALADLCVSIESAPEQPSLNLSHAAALALYTLSDAKDAPLQAVDTADIQRASDRFMHLLDTAEYFKSDDRKESFSIYLEKILTRGIKEKTDALVVENLLLRLSGIIRRKLGGK